MNITLRDVASVISFHKPLNVSVALDVIEVVSSQLYVSLVGKVELNHHQMINQA